MNPELLYKVMINKKDRKCFVFLQVNHFGTEHGTAKAAMTQTIP